jgi:hypothetical protein
VDERAPPAAARGDAVAQHGDDVVEVLPREPPVRPRAAHQREEIVRADLARRHRGDALLRQDVERVLGDAEPVQLPRAHGAHGGRGLHEVVAREREDDPLRHGAHRVAGAADALDERGQRPRRAHVADEVDGAHVDAQLEGRRRHHHRHLARLEPRLGLEADAAGHAAVVRGDAVRAEPALELVRDALDQPARVDEDDRGLVRAHVAGDAVVDVRPQLVRGDRAQLPVGDFDRQVERAAVPHVHDLARAARGPDQQAGHLLDGLLRRREADPLEAPAGERVEALERDGQVEPALVAGHGVDLVHDDRAGAGQEAAAPLRRQQYVEGLRRGDEDVGRPADHRLALAGRGVARADERADLGERGAAQLLQLRQRARRFRCTSLPSALSGET